MTKDLILNKISWLDNLGRASRSKKNEKLENFLTDLQRLTIVYESDHGESHFRFSSPSKTNTDDVAQQEEKGLTKKTGWSGKEKGSQGGQPKEDKGQYAGTSGGGAEEGDKTLADDHGASSSAIAQREAEKRGDGPQMTDDDASGSDHIKVER